MGVYISDGEHSFIIAPDETTSDFEWGGYGKTVSNIVTTTNESTALADFVGSSNTDQIIYQLSGTTDSKNVVGAPAAEYCRAYSKGCKGVGDWYLPAAGEMNIIVNNKDTINAALTKISGTLLDWLANTSAVSNYHYVLTSTQYDSNYAWYYSWKYNLWGRVYKYNGYCVRPICSF